MIGRHESKNLTESFSFLIFHMEKQMQHHEWEVLKLWMFINNLIPHVCDSFMPAGSSTKLQLWPFKTAINNIAFRPENIHHVQAGQLSAPHQPQHISPLIQPSEPTLCIKIILCKILQILLYTQGQRLEITLSLTLWSSHILIEKWKNTFQNSWNIV